MSSRSLLVVGLLSTLACHATSPSPAPAMSSVPASSASAPHAAVAVPPDAVEPVAKVASNPSAPVAADSGKDRTSAAADPPLARMRPFFDAHFASGWISVSVPATDHAAWQRVMDATSAGGGKLLWAGSRLVPDELRELGPIHVVSATGVVRFDSLVRVGADTSGWQLDYRRGSLAGPGLAMKGAPDERARVRKGGPTKSIKRTHPLAEHMRSLLTPDAIMPAERRRLTSYKLQITAGNFRGATRIAAVTAIDPGGDEYSDGFGVIFTVGDDDVVQQKLQEADMLRVEGVVDIDGDGYDEVITANEGYETGSRDLLYLSADGVEVINLFSHDE